ncbi:MAG: riboflavin biosynthesis protein RibF [Bacteroidetes bacterium]|nr:MAG: riboflavin biosynthesis protein RibF [Bacteroidota bacterium]
MKVYKNIKEVKGVKNAVVTTGTFDGVHLGHRAVFNVMKDEARKINGETVVITFFPHPRFVLGLDTESLKFINTQQKKISLMEQAGIDHLIIIEFTKEFAKNSSETFIREYIIKPLNPKRVIIGHDHHFGRNRHGSYELLYNLGKESGFDVIKVAPLQIDALTVSSTKIRKLLEEGNVHLANKLLGYEYSITGMVVHGNGIGRTIGYPTANIEVGNEYKLIAANGVYACRVDYNGVTYKGMANIGFRPTINQSTLTIEVNIFDFDKDIYNETITISFVDRLRSEVKFNSLTELKNQLTLDKEKAQEIL